MAFLDLPSGNSLWRGYDYYKENKVKACKQTDETHYCGSVSGNGLKGYSVEIDVVHPRKSKCNCPHANGKRIICKHQVALYFKAYPDEAVRFYNDYLKDQEEEEKRQEDREDKLISYVHSMSKADLASTLLQVLFDGPEWVYERFIEENRIDEL